MGQCEEEKGGGDRQGTGGGGGGGGWWWGLRNSYPRGKGDREKDRGRGWRVKDQP